VADFSGIFFYGLLNVHGPETTLRKADMRDPESTPETDRSDFVSHFINKHVQLVAVNRLVPAKNNAKRHSPQQIQKLATSPDFSQPQPPLGFRSGCGAQI
jgi:hypothetical protein